MTIKNSTIGLRCDLTNGLPATTTTLTDTQIYNSSVNGLLAIGSDISAENLVIGNSGQASLNIVLGGRYDFTHCTLTNYWTSGFRSFPTVSISNKLETDNILISDLSQADFTNCIIYGNENLELTLDYIEPESTNFNYRFENCLIKFNDFTNQFSGNPLYDFDGGNYPGYILNENPNFLDSNNNEFLIELGNSPAQNSGLTLTPPGVDILNNPRNATNPDIGAYNAGVFPSED